MVYEILKELKNHVIEIVINCFFSSNCFSDDLFIGCHLQYVNERNNHSKGPSLNLDIHHLLKKSCDTNTITNNTNPSVGAIPLILSVMSK